MKLRYLESAPTIEYNPEKCAGCSACVKVCPHRVFTMENGRAVLADKGGCIECGACVQNCPAKAIKVNKGVGCAQAIIGSMKKGGPAECGCSGSACC